MSQEERYIFIEGTGEMFIDNQWVPVKPLEFVVVSPNDPHSVRNTGAGKLVFITLRTIG
jgi:mannose-6-phosphate isomerase-like protein (cupin superfamily)